MRVEKGNQSPLDEIYEKVVGKPYERCEITPKTTSRYRYNASLPKKTGLRQQSQQSNQSEILKTIRNGVTDSLPGVGEYASRTAKSFLSAVSPGFRFVGAAIPRALGGIAAAGTAGYRLYQSARNDQLKGNYSFPEMRKELVVSAASISSGIAVGYTGYLVSAAALAAGAPVAVLGGVGAATVLGAGYVSYRVRGSVQQALQ